MAPANVHTDVDEKAGESFLNEIGVSEAVLVGIVIAVTTLGLLCFCVGCPIIASMQSLKARCLDDPERTDRKNIEKLNRILEKKQEVAALEKVIEERSVAYDDWGLPQRVDSKQHRDLEKHLEHQRKILLRDEQFALGRQVKEAKMAERRRRREQHRARLQKMREAYVSRTLAVDGVVLRAPHAVLVDLGFDASMIEVFGMPGFRDFDAERHAKTDAPWLDLREGGEGRQDSDLNSTDNPDNEEEAAAEEEEEVEREETGSDAEEGNDRRANQLAAPSFTASIADDGTLKMPPHLEEITAAVLKEGFEQRKRRGAIADSKEGKPMDPGELRRAMKIAASLKVKGDVMWKGILSMSEDVDKDTQLELEDNERNSEGDEDAYLDSSNYQHAHDFDKAGASDEETEHQTETMVCVQARSVDVPYVAPKCNMVDGACAGKELDGGTYLPRRPQVDGAVSQLADDSMAQKKDNQLERSRTKIYGGMAVRPRGFGTPRSLMLDAEVFRSSLDAPKMSHPASQR